MIWFYLIVGIVCAGIKFPFDLARGSNADRYEYLESVQWGLASGDAEIELDLDRIRTNADGRGLSHHTTALAISWVRWGLRDARGVPKAVNTGPGFVKLLCALVVWPNLIWLAASVWGLRRRARTRRAELAGVVG